MKFRTQGRAMLRFLVFVLFAGILLLDLYFSVSRALGTG